MKASTPTRDYIGQSISGGLKTNSKSFSNFLWEAETRWKGSELQQGITSSFSWVLGRSSPTATQHWEARIEPAKVRISSFANLHFCFAGSLCLRVTCANCETLLPTTDGALFSKVGTYNLNQTYLPKNFLQGDIFVNNICVLCIYNQK